MLVASICHEIYYTVLPTTMTSRVPRCLFGRPNSRETIEMLQEALDAERSKFARRWGVDPCSEENKENNYQRRNNERSDRSPGKKRSNPYSRQTSIHDYWRARKVCDVNKKPLTTTMDVSKQNVESSKTTKTTTMTTTTTITKTT
ncbi:uncharacterized protein [Temnothorax nylanderi]|uniref:uncharacterized protein n=1 Tax=Temnothorax nylanderi TaxID=102681 RepID=UPI003A858499